MKKLLVIVVLAVLSLSASSEEIYGCMLNTHNNEKDFSKSVFNTAIDCIKIASHDQSCVKKIENSETFTYDLEDNLLCTQLDDNNNKIRTLIVFKQNKNGEKMKMVVNKASGQIEVPAGFTVTAAK